MTSAVFGQCKCHLRRQTNPWNYKQRHRGIYHYSTSKKISQSVLHRVLSLVACQYTNTCRVARTPSQRVKAATCDQVHRTHTMLCYAITPSQRHKSQRKRNEISLTLKQIMKKKYSNNSLSHTFISNPHVLMNKIFSKLYQRNILENVKKSIFCLGTRRIDCSY